MEITEKRRKQKYGHLWSQVLVDSCDLWLLSVYAWRIHFDGKNHYVVSGCRIDGKYMLRWLHRMIMNAPPGVQVDHINGNALDNRRCNLRLCTNTKNQYNQKSRCGTSKFKGVRWHRRDQKWSVQICKDRRCIHLGYFDNEVEAARAYDRAARKYFGDFARLNFQEAA